MNNNQILKKISAVYQFIQRNITGDEGVSWYECERYKPWLTWRNVANCYELYMIDLLNHFGLPSNCYLDKVVVGNDADQAFHDNRVFVRAFLLLLKHCYDNGPLWGAQDMKKLEEMRVGAEAILFQIGNANIECLSCGELIKRDQNRCSQCGWTWL